MKREMFAPGARKAALFSVVAVAASVTGVASLDLVRGAAAGPVMLSPDSAWAPLGELLTYRVDALGIEAGLVRIGVTERFDLGDRVFATLAAEAHARGIYHAMHPIVDEIFSRIDVGARRPIETRATYGDPGDRWHLEMDYIAAAGARTEVNLAGTGKKPRSWAHALKADTHDILTAMYAARGRSWAPGDHMSALVYVGWDLFAVEVQAKKREWIATSFGPEHAVLLEISAVRAPNPRLAPPPKKRVVVKAPGSAKPRPGTAVAASARTASPRPASARPVSAAASAAATAAAKAKPPTVHRVEVWITDDARHVPLEARASYEGIGIRATLVDRSVPSS